MAHTSQAGVGAYGLQGFRADPGLYIAQYKEGKTYILVYAIQIAAKNMAVVASIKERLISIFDIRDLGEAKYFLGMSLNRNRQV